MIISRSVWYEQIDTALVNLIKNTLPDIKDVIISIPEDDLIENKELDSINIPLPYVLIRHVGELFDNRRYDINNNKIIISAENGKAKIEDLAKPYVLQFQIDIYTEYQRDINNLTMLWNSKILPKTMLKVKDTSGAERYCKMFMKPSIGVLNTSRNEQRLFRKIYLYDFWVEIDETEITEVNIPTDIIIK